MCNFIEFADLQRNSVAEKITRRIVVKLCPSRFDGRLSLSRGVDGWQ